METDQRELFSDELTPAITLYRGKQIENIPFTQADSSTGLAIAEQGNCSANADDILTMASEDLKQ